MNRPADKPPTEKEIAQLRSALDEEREIQERAHEFLGDKFADVQQYGKSGTIILEVNVKNGRTQKMRGRLDESLFERERGD